MLKERIRLTDEGFRVERDSLNPDRTAYFTKFRLEDGTIDRISGEPLSYWEVLNPYGQRVADKTFVCVWETERGNIVEEHFFYINRTGSRPRLCWNMERSPKYGDQAYKITLKWPDQYYEPIHKNHIWLLNRQDGKKYAFLKEFIEPMDKEGRIKKDEYIIDVPEHVNVAELSIEGDELLCQKYLLIKEE